MKDLKNNKTSTLPIPPDLQTDGTVNGASSDRSKHEGVTYDFVVGNWTDGSHVCSLEDSPDDSVWTAVAAADIDGTPPTVGDATLDDSVQTVAYKGIERYVRPKIVTTGSTTGAQVGCLVHLGASRYRSPSASPFNL